MGTVEIVLLVIGIIWCSKSGEQGVPDYRQYHRTENAGYRR